MAYRSTKTNNNESNRINNIDLASNDETKKHKIKLICFLSMHPYINFMWKICKVHKVKRLTSYRWNFHGGYGGSHVGSHHLISLVDVVSPSTSFFAWCWLARSSLSMQCSSTLVFPLNYPSSFTILK